jgi:hypothetical protein
MIIDEDKEPFGSLIKLGTSDDAEFPDSSAGNTPHCGGVIAKPTLGMPFYLRRANGLFGTSFVKEIVEETDNRVVFKTNNSVYQLSINLFEGID